MDNKKCLDYFEGDSLSTDVFFSKYAVKGEETPDDMHKRMAKEFARIEDKFGGKKLTYDDIYNLFKKFKYIIPGGSVMSGLGNPYYKGSLSNCFVIGKCYDSYCSIMKYRDYMVELEKRRGGVGVDLSNLRPADTFVNNAAKTSTGPVSFMNGFSELSKEVAQGGRRGALMISISGDHPDVLKFIECKQDLTKITGANISVKFSDKFLKAVEDNADYYLRFPIETNLDEIDYDYESLEYNTLTKIGDGNVYVKRVRAKEIWDKFIYCSWNTAEPGIMYEDMHLFYSPDGVYEQFRGVTTNPCGEIFMGPYDSCRLMHINLSSFVKSDKTFDFDLLKEVSKNNLRLCDDLVELELEHVQDIINHIKSTYVDDNRNELELWEHIYETGKSSRRCGCGATGLADAIAKMGLKFGSVESFKVVEKIFYTKMLGELEMEVQLAKERGTFIGSDTSKEFEVKDGKIIGKNGFYSLISTEFSDLCKELFENGRRNVSWSTMAPVGSGAILCQCSSGVEPVFSAYYKRRRKCASPEDKVDFVDKTGEKFSEYFIVHKPFKDWIISNCDDYDKSKTFDDQLNDDKLQKWFEKSPWFGSTANELTPLQHVQLQSIVQKYITHSISKTINLPNKTTVEEVSKLYIDGWHLHCKGLTVYRDGCRDGVLLKKDANKECKCSTNTTLVHAAPRRPKSLTCDVKRFKNYGDKWIACVGLYQGEPYEIFTGLAEKVDLPEYIDKCSIIKNKVEKEVYNEETCKNELKKVSSYDLLYTDKSGNFQMIENIGGAFRSEFYTVSKLVSALLRHGMPIEYVISTIKSLDFKNNTINSWKMGVIRALKSYVKDGEIQGEVCPECGSKIVRENGCKHCSSCGWSACN